MYGSLTINQLKDEKSRLEKEITINFPSQLLDDFIKKTGIIPEGLVFRFIDIRKVTDSPGEIKQRLSGLDICLPSIKI